MKKKLFLLSLLFVGCLLVPHTEEVRDSYLTCRLVLEQYSPKQFLEDVREDGVLEFSQSLIEDYVMINDLKRRGRW
jgi:hypothetical protein